MSLYCWCSFPGGSYVEGTEARLRTRYAVVSALGVACFVPEDSEHIGYVEWKPRPPVPAIVPYEKLKVPYEWYRPRKFQQCKGTIWQPQRILVMWLNEDAFTEQPLQRLSWLTADVKGLRNTATMKFKAIGPASSTTLRAIGKMSLTILRTGLMRNAWNSIRRGLPLSRVYWR